MTWWVAFSRMRKEIKRAQNGSLRCFLYSSFGGHKPSLPQDPIGYTSCPCSVWEETTQGSECQEVKIIGGHHGDWLSQEAKIFVVKKKWLECPPRKEVECKTDGVFSSCAVRKDIEKDRTSGAERVDRQVSVCSRYIWLEQNLARWKGPGPVKSWRPSERGWTLFVNDESWKVFEQVSDIIIGIF